MAKNTISKLREKSGLTQSALAEKLNVTRQTVSSWEIGRTEPDIESMTRMAEIFGIDMNELTGFNTAAVNSEIKKPHFEIILAAAAIPAIITTILGGQDNIFIVWTLIVCALTTVVPLSHMAKSGDFTMLAGYDKNSKYNTNELSKMLYSMCMHISCETLAFTVIIMMCSIADLGKLVSVIVTLAYVVSLLITILLVSKKYEKAVYIKKNDASKDKEFNLVANPYIVLITAQCIVLTLKCQLDKVHGAAVAFCFTAFAAETIWLLYEYMRKENKSEYSPRKKLRYATIAFGILCTIAMLIKFN